LYIDLPNDQAGGQIFLPGQEQQLPASSKSSMAVMGGAAGAAGLLGVCLLGPVSAVVLAGGAAYAATRKDEVGTAARATGSASLTVGEKVYQAGKRASKEASKFDNKYDISGTMARGLTSAAKGLESIFSKATSTSTPTTNTNNNSSNLM
jgi:hypothetical protein